MPSLVLIGTEDMYYDESALEELRSSGGCDVRVYEGVGHDLQVKGDAETSIGRLGEMFRDTKEFLESMLG